MPVYHWHDYNDHIEFIQQIESQFKKIQFLMILYQML